MSYQGNDLHPSLAGYGNKGQGPKSDLLWGAVRNSSVTDVEKLSREVDDLNRQVEATRQAYNALLEERDQLKKQANNAHAKLTEVQRVVSRYAVVEEPVVASDGFTYERRVIKQYLRECEESNSDAISQQTKEVLTDTLLANMSLQKLVNLLKEVRPEPVPEISDRRPIGEGRGGSSGLQLGSDKHQQGGDNDGAVLASDLEASWSAAAAGKTKRNDGGNREQGGGRGRQDDSTQGGRLHPCIRVYGFCNYKDECAFARYPYDACLNNIKGKCRFGSSCKELHINPVDNKFRNPKAQQSLAQAIGQANRPGSQPGSPASGPIDTDRSRPSNQGPRDQGRDRDPRRK